MEMTHGRNQCNLGFYNEEPLSLLFTLGHAGVTAFTPMTQTAMAALAADSVNASAQSQTGILNEVLSRQEVLRAGGPGHAGLKAMNQHALCSHVFQELHLPQV